MYSSSETRGHPAEELPGHIDKCPVIASPAEPLTASAINLAWHPGLSVYASEGFLRAVSDEYGWLGGKDRSEKLRCILPYTLVKKSFIRMVRFRVETIPVATELSVEEERSFLDSAVEYFRARGAAVIIPAATNTLFRAYPRQAIAAPYASHIVDLTPSEDTLWENVHSKHRNVIRNARNKGVEVHCGGEYADVAYAMIRATFQRSRMAFMSHDAFHRMLQGLGEYVKVFVAKQGGDIHGCAVIPFSHHSAYYAYGGSSEHPLSGATNLLQWEAMRRFRDLGVKRYDFCGARIDPEKGSKAAGLIMYKERFGGDLQRGYMWKCNLLPLRAAVYGLAVRYLRGGDIVDQECRKFSQSPAAPR